MTISPESNSSGTVRVLERLRYLFDLFRMRLDGRGKYNNSRNVSRIQEYESIASKHGIELRSSQILEIGVGQRPYLGITLHALGYCYCGIDLDLPIYPATPLKWFRLYRLNGSLRLIKSFFRCYLFDRPEYYTLFQSLGLTPSSFGRSHIFVQGDAASVDLHSILFSI